MRPTAAAAAGSRLLSLPSPSASLSARAFFSKKKNRKSCRWRPSEEEEEKGKKKSAALVRERKRKRSSTARCPPPPTLHRTGGCSPTLLHRPASQPAIEPVWPWQAAVVRERDSTIEHGRPEQLGCAAATTNHSERASLWGRVWDSRVVAADRLKPCVPSER